VVNCLAGAQNIRMEDITRVHTGRHSERGILHGGRTVRLQVHPFCNEQVLPDASAVFLVQPVEE